MKEEIHSPLPNDLSDNTRSRMNHNLSVIAVCTCTFVNGYLLISIFPYAGFMSMNLINKQQQEDLLLNNVVPAVAVVTEENAGYCAGLLASSFMAGRSLSAYFVWGILADSYGRKPALLYSLIFSGILSILFGLSRTFSGAILTRFLLGFCNSLQSTSKTVITEIARGDEKLETRGTGLVIGMRSLGFLISPAIGGILADPIKQYPSLFLVDAAHTTKEESFLQKLFESYPFVLPNIVGFILCMISALAILYIDETLPDTQRRDIKYLWMDLYDWIKKQLLKRIKRQQSFLHEGENQPLNNNKNKNDETQKIISNHDDENQTQTQTTTPSSMSLIWNRKATRDHLIAYWLFSFVVVCVDEAFPLYCISKTGGLGITEKQIGKILSLAGAIFVLGQYSIFANFMNVFGLYKSLAFGALIGVPITILIPIVNLQQAQVEFEVEPNIEDEKERMKWSTLIFLALIMGISKIFSCLFFAGITIATNRTVPSHLRGKMNGLNMLGGSISKGLGPIFAGALVAFSFSSFSSSSSPSLVFVGSGLMIWGTIALLGVLVYHNINLLGTGQIED